MSHKATGASSPMCDLLVVRLVGGGGGQTSGIVLSSERTEPSDSNSLAPQTELDYTHTTCPLRRWRGEGGLLTTEGGGG